MQVQFNLDLSEKEREDRSRVILPFEHQGLCYFAYSRMIRIRSVIHVFEIRIKVHRRRLMQESRLDPCQVESISCYAF